MQARCQPEALLFYNRGRTKERVIIMRENSGRARRREKRGNLPAWLWLAPAAVLAAGCLFLGAKRITEKNPPQDPPASAAAGIAGEPAPAVSPAPQSAPPAAQSVASPPPTAAPPSSSAPGADDPDEGWHLLLVNPWHALPAGYEVTLTQLKNGHAVDERCYPDLQAMMDDCRAAGLNPVICSSYRTQEKQEQLFAAQMAPYLDAGCSPEEARRQAAKAVAVPGTSEHQLGLAVDIVDEANQNLDESQEDTAVQQWLMENSWQYGFILRYPNDKSEVTGIIYEPWHYRYVGKAAAEEIWRQGVCLEEYLQQLEA